MSAESARSAKSPVEAWTSYARTWLAVEGERGAIMNLAAHVGLLSKRVKEAERKVKLLEKKMEAKK